MNTVYLVYHCAALEIDDGVYDPSSYVDYVAPTLDDALDYIKYEDTSDVYWWKIEVFDVGHNYNEDEIDEEDYESPDHHVGWFDHKGNELEGSPFQEIVQRLLNSSGDTDCIIA